MTSQRDIFLRAAESVQQRGLNKDGSVSSPDGAACTYGHLYRVTPSDSRVELKSVVDGYVANLGYEFVTDWNDDHASAEDVILMFKTLAEETDS